jgi:hypothetical protein
MDYSRMSNYTMRNIFNQQRMKSRNPVYHDLFCALAAAFGSPRLLKAVKYSSLDEVKHWGDDGAISVVLPDHIGEFATIRPPIYWHSIYSDTPNLATCVANVECDPHVAIRLGARLIIGPRVHQEGCNVGVHVLKYDRRRSQVFVHEERPGKHLTLPGGKLQDGETTGECLSRELLEEGFPFPTMIEGYGVSQDSESGNACIYVIVRDCYTPSNGMFVHRNDVRVAPWVRRVISDYSTMMWGYQAQGAIKDDRWRDLVQTVFVHRLISNGINHVWDSNTVFGLKWAQRVQRDVCK